MGIRLIALVAFTVGSALVSFGQGIQRDLDFWRPPDQRGVNMFEPGKKDKDSITFEGVRIRVGGAFALQYQGLEHSNNATPVFPDPTDPSFNSNQLINIGNAFNLPTANFDLDGALAPGVRVHLRTYMSSRHHPESWVKGGYIQIDRLDFIQEDFLSGLMDMMAIKIGLMEINYGDQHFRRTDNGQALHNPFVGNYIMDAFTTEMAGELYFFRDGAMVMLGLTNGKLNQSVTNLAAKPAFLFKAAYDKQANVDFRYRVSGSIYTILGETSSTSLYGGDRGGSRYYFVTENTRASASGNFTSGRINPGFSNKLTAVMFNAFLKYKGFELFGTYEISQGQNISADADTRTWNQLAADLIYRFGGREQLYVGGRINTVGGPLTGTTTDVSAGRLAGVAGWFMTPNVLAKVEVIDQNYSDYPTDNILSEANFRGVMLEAVIAF